ncbi:MAG TPA: hypothetical protein VFC58_04700 [Desulfosporosinus sp.]|nr:hypothetical protein [Desulfosporosinus sp.]
MSTIKAMSRKQCLRGAVQAAVTDDYIIFLQQDSNCNDVTVATYIRGIRAHIYYLMKLKYIERR